MSKVAVVYWSQTGNTDKTCVTVSQISIRGDQQWQWLILIFSLPA